MIDIVIPLDGALSFWGNNELRYCLRSIYKHLSGYRNIYLVGDKPDFIHNVIHISHTNWPECKEANIHQKILMACRRHEMSEDFLFLNDDHFLTSAFKATEFPFFYQGTLDKIIYERQALDTYKEALIHTYFELNDKSLPVKYFDVHTPILYNKIKFMIATSVDWANKQYVIKSLYANTFQIEGAEYMDAKIDTMPENFDEYIKGKLMFSTGGGYSMGKKILPYLEKLYPEKSPWEV